ncbi:Zn-ribbon domain containing protein [Halanaeroarchaeum sp. HSR-CO]|uniref:DUF5518 domain-containing protein n=1 Tax=Halanaeroarchaeum sp. HSR-CO TaxID=2866382 RepID=UPI00217D643B|nr:DUF5518 domain-containing protein [Halanaeroarchaeum sp. HSR-CO]UWG47905.1 Zn-ribbon domain containing protein [Halanaeroarchaeum sp. HSR-CO]
MDTRRTGIAVLLGALVSIVAGFLPFVSFVAPLLGGAVAGYLQRSGWRDGATAGGLMGVVLAVIGVLGQALSSVLPPFPAAVILGPWARGFGLGLDSVVVFLVASAVLLVLVGAIGGAIGGRFGNRQRTQTWRKLG